MYSLFHEFFALPVEEKLKYDTIGGERGSFTVSTHLKRKMVVGDSSGQGIVRTMRYGCNINNFLPEESFKSWGNYGRVLGNTKSWLTDRLLTQSSDESELHKMRARCQNEMTKLLNWFDMMWFGSVLGAGVFFLTGQAARDYVGPAVIISYLISVNNEESASEKIECHPISLVEDVMTSNFTDLNEQPLGLQDQVVIALRRLSSGESLLTVLYSFQIHKATVGNITWRFVEAMEQNGIHHIQWPSTGTKMRPCGHSFCLNCFQRWVGQGNYTCAKCRCSIPPKMASQPRIKSLLVFIIRMAKMSI